MGGGQSVSGSDASNTGNHKTANHNKAVRFDNKPATIKDGAKTESDVNELDNNTNSGNISISAVLPNYPHVKAPPKFVQSEFDVKTMKNVDRRAKEAPKALADNFDKLIAYLIDGYNTDTEKVRSIFIWMFNQKIRTGDFKNVPDGDTPKGLIKRVNEERESIATMFAILCRKANIPCVIVEGHSKGVNYKVGSSEASLKSRMNRWNAVYCDGYWRLVSPLWALSGVVGHSSGTRTLVQQGGKVTNKKETKSAGKEVEHLDEDYFFADPEIFIYTNIPKDPRWQLLTKTWDISKFASVPLCKPKFFHEEMVIHSKFSGRLVTHHGECHIELGTNDPIGLTLDYKLYYDHEESGQDAPSVQLTNYVLLNRANGRWNFGIRFPEKGVYQFEVSGGRATLSDLCEFRIDCKIAQEDCQPLPFNPGTIGYGPNSDTEAAGIQAVSHKSGVVKMHVRKQMEFKFNLVKHVNVKTELKHTTLPSSELDRYCVQQQRNRMLIVLVTMPQNGEYTLAMFVQRDGKEGRFDNVCNYLLTSDDRNKKQRLWETPIEKEIRNKIRELSLAEGSKKVKELEKMIELFHKNDMVDKGEIATGQDALDCKQDMRELENAIKRRHLGTLQKAIDRGNKSRFKHKFTELLQEAMELRDHLQQLKNISHDILEMNQATIAEMRAYNNPKPVVVNIMRATFLVLGVKPIYVQTWMDVQELLGKTGTDSLISMVKRFDTVSVSDDVLRTVRKLVGGHTETEARLVSAGAGTFFVWLRDVCHVIDHQETTAGSEET